MTHFTDTRNNSPETEGDVIFAFITTDLDLETKAKEVYVSHEIVTVSED